MKSFSRTIRQLRTFLELTEPPTLRDLRQGIGTISAASSAWPRPLGLRGDLVYMKLKDGKGGTVGLIGGQGGHSLAAVLVFSTL